MERILQQLGLANILSRFVDEKVDEKIVLSSTDSELSRLGVSTIGDRVRLRELCKQALQASQATSSSASTSQEVRQLFHNRRGSRKGTTQAKKRTWTAQMVCLADRLSYKVPSAVEKQVLFKAGLGLKKIKLEVDDDEETVIKKITSGDTENDSTEVLGFPQLRNCGGFELMHCVANCRELVVIDGSWATKELKGNGGAQSKIYLRPIQKNLSTKPLATEKTSQVKEKCNGCNKEILVHELRRHILLCRDIFDTSESSGEDRQGDRESTLNQSPIVNSLAPLATSSPSTSPSAHSNITPSTMGTSSLAPIIIQPDENTQDIQEIEEKTVDDIVAELVHYCSSNDISNPIEILSCYQSMFVQGRALEIKDPTVCEAGDTNIIFIDRGNALDTAFDEVDQIQNIRTTLEVEFYGEGAKDYGGPRKEFFLLVLNAIKDKYFDKGLRQHLSEKYETIGKIMGLSIVQNGKLPNFLAEELLNSLIQTSSNEDPCIFNLQKGLQQLGIIQILRQLPTFKFLLIPRQKENLSIRKLISFLKPMFSEEGSNNLQFEKEVYALFIKYLREVAAGRRDNMSLENILQFVTGVDEEPILGYTLQPAIAFVEVESSFLPTANTCINQLNLPRPSLGKPLPINSIVVFELYDYAFVNNYFGMV